MSHKMCFFFAQFQVFVKNKIKTVTCLMHYNPLHHWSNIQTNLTIFQWVTYKKPPRSSLKLYLLLVWKHLRTTKLKNYKSDINGTWPRYVPPDIYQNMRVSMNGQMGVSATKKPPENAMKLKESWLSHHLKKVYKMILIPRTWVSKWIALVKLFCKLALKVS